MKMYLKGFPLKRTPDSIDAQGRAVFDVETDEQLHAAIEKARQHLFPGVQIKNEVVDRLLMERNASMTPLTRAING